MVFFTGQMPTKMDVSQQAHTTSVP